MTERRSGRARKTINYSKLGESDDSDDDFHEFKSQPKKNKIETVKNGEQNKSKTVEKLVLKRNSENGALKVESPKPRLAVEEKVFQRQINEALEASKIDTVKSKTNSKNKDSDSKDESYHNNEEEDDDDEEYSSDSSASEESDFSESSEMKSTKSKKKSNALVQKTAEVKLNEKNTKSNLEKSSEKTNSESFTKVTELLENKPDDNESDSLEEDSESSSESNSSEESNFSDEDLKSSNKVIKKISPLKQKDALKNDAEKLNKKELKVVITETAKKSTIVKEPLPNTVNKTTQNAVPKKTAQNTVTTKTAQSIEPTRTSQNIVPKKTNVKSESVILKSSPQTSKPKISTSSPILHSSPIKLPPKGIRLGLSRKVPSKPLHVGVKPQP